VGINMPYRRARGKAADKRIRSARNTAGSEIEVVIDEGSDEEKEDRLCVRVVLLDNSMTEKWLYSLIGDQVPTRRNHPRHYMSVKRKHGVIVMYKKEGVKRLLLMKSEYARFLEYHHVKGENDYITIKVVGEFGDVTERDLRREMERLSGLPVIGGWFETMKEGVGYLDFQDEKILDWIGRYPYIKVKGKYLNLEAIELRTEDPLKLVFFRGLSTRISKEKFRQGLQQAGKINEGKGGEEIEIKQQQKRKEKKRKKERKGTKKKNRKGRKRRKKNKKNKKNKKRKQQKKERKQTEKKMTKSQKVINKKTEKL